jgi:hypothetical protein
MNLRVAQAAMILSCCLEGVANDLTLTPTVENEWNQFIWSRWSSKVFDFLKKMLYVYWSARMHACNPNDSWIKKHWIELKDEVSIRECQPINPVYNHPPRM